MPASEPAALEISEYENAGDHGHPLSQRHVLKRMYGSREERLQLKWSSHIIGVIQSEAFT